MPIKKEDQDLYGKIVGKNINSGKSLNAAKRIADKAVKSNNHNKPKKKVER